MQIKIQFESQYKDPKVLDGIDAINIVEGFMFFMNVLGRPSLILRVNDIKSVEEI